MIFTHIKIRNKQPKNPKLKQFFFLLFEIEKNKITYTKM